MLANVIGLVGYVLLPTAPPRMLPEFGFSDTLATLGAPNHGSSFVALASNPYAAMPSLGRRAVVGSLPSRRSPILVALARLAGLGLISAMATGNHFWLDIASASPWPASPRRSCTGARSGALARLAPAH
jgi:hypothetical protein